MKRTLPELKKFKNQFYLQIKTVSTYTLYYDIIRIRVQNQINPNVV